MYYKSGNCIYKRITDMDENNGCYIIETFDKYNIIYVSEVSYSEKGTAQLRGEMPVRCAVQCSLMGLCQRPCYSAIRMGWETPPAALAAFCGTCARCTDHAIPAHIR